MTSEESSPNSDLAEGIVRAARGWIGTRFHHQGRLKRTDTHRGGCDCLGLLVGVAQELQLPVISSVMGEAALLASFDRKDYGHYPDAEGLCSAMADLMDVVPLAERQVGDIVALSIDGHARHLAILTPYNATEMGLIHAYAPARQVIEHRLDGIWLKRIARVFRIRSLGYQR